MLVFDNLLGIKPAIPLSKKQGYSNNLLILIPNVLRNGMKYMNAFIDGKYVCKTNSIGSRPFFWMPQQIETCISMVSKSHARSNFFLLVMGQLLLFLLLPYTALALDYGEQGPYVVVREKIENPLSGDSVTILLPKDAQTPLPVMFFSHGLGGNIWWFYRSILNHVASQGVAVVFSPYPTHESWQNQYDILWNGFLEAANKYPYEFDLDRVGFFGHSMGGGAVPNMALRAVDEGWGRLGKLLFIMAPAPCFGVSDQELQSLTEGTMIVQSFGNDSVVPHRWAKDIYSNIGIPREEKAYYYIISGEHSEPSNRAVDLYDSLAIWAPLDALMDSAFELDDPYGGKTFALEKEEDHYQTLVFKELTDETP